MILSLTDLSDEPLQSQIVRQIRAKILAGQTADIASDTLSTCIAAEIKKLSSYSLLPLINATGIVIHTNLGRSILSEWMTIK